MPQFPREEAWSLDLLSLHLFGLLGPIPAGHKHAHGVRSCLTQMPNGHGWWCPCMSPKPAAPCLGQWDRSWPSDPATALCIAPWQQGECEKYSTDFFPSCSHLLVGRCFNSRMTGKGKLFAVLWFLFESLSLVYDCRIFFINTITLVTEFIISKAV